MHSRFKVHNAFALKSRKVYVLEGRLTQGMIEQGMDLRYTDGRGGMALLPIESVEYSLHREAGESIEMVCLCIYYKDDETLERFRLLRLQNRVFVVSEPIFKVPERFSEEERFTYAVHEDRPAYGKEAQELLEKKISKSSVLKKPAIKRGAKKKK